MNSIADTIFFELLSVSKNYGFDTHIPGMLKPNIRLFLPSDGFSEMCYGNKYLISTFMVI